MVGSIKYLLHCILFFAIGILTAQEIPPVNNYLPEEYNGGNQNWMISQSENLNIYIANNDGLLEFNGTNWKRYDSPNESIIRSVKTVKDKIYTGCYMEFGYWQQDVTNKLQYTSLSAFVKDKLIEDEHFWRIIPYDNWILFQSLHQIFIYNTQTKEFKIINDENGIVFLYKIDSSLVFQVPGKGIFEIENGDKKLICDDPKILNTRIVNILSYRNDNLLVTEADGLFTLREGKVDKITLPVNAILNTTNIYSAFQLQNNDLVFGTISKGVVITDQDGKVRYHLQNEEGLANNTVLYIFEDVDSNVWLGLDNGLSCLNLDSPIRTYDDYKGTIGTVYVAISHNKKLYIGTNQGLFYKSENTTEPFTMIEGTKGQVWSLWEKEGQLFCGHDKGTFLIDNEQAVLIADIEGVWNFREIPGKPDWLLQGSYEGLSILERTKTGRWKLRNKIEGFSYSSMFFEFINETTLYVSHEHKGIFRLQFDSSYTKVPKVIRLEDPGKGKTASLVKFKNSLIYANKEGIFRLGKGEKKFSKDPLLTTIIEGNRYFTGKMEIDDTGKLWVSTKNNIHYITQGKLSDKPVINNISIPLSLRKTVGGFENITHINNDTYLVGSKKGFFTIDLSSVKDRDYDVIINDITVSNLKKNKNSLISLAGKGTFDHDSNHITFNYSVPEYQKYILTKYQYKLIGLYEYWSDWSPESTAKFENLPPGDYQFQVRGKVGNAITKNTNSYEFKIKSPWYFSLIMQFIYGLLFILLLFFINAMYKRYYRIQQEEIMERNKKELELVKIQNEKEFIKLRNDQLNRELKNKSKELAASTMNIVRKNELLTEIKNHLVKLDEKQVISPVLKIIDNNLNSNDNWELFKEAFNNVDTDFLNKLNTLHPNLSPNDVKLCAYLRLNLTSKEIAPLFNISTRSVEIKRYRLRKKLGLEHEENLVSYILDL